MILPEEARRLRLTRASSTGIMHLTSSISNLKKQYVLWFVLSLIIKMVARSQPGLFL